jgi:hypothetical protein
MSEEKAPSSSAAPEEKLTEEEWYYRYVVLNAPARQPGESALATPDNGPGFAPNSEMPLYARSKSRLTNPEKHRKSQLYARLTYAAIILTFLSVCSTAVFFTMQMESKKTGFRAIHVKKPISFFDYTYVDKKQKTNQ